MPYRYLLPSARSIAALSALAFFASATPASAYEYCRRDVTGFMLGCSFDTWSNVMRRHPASAAIASAIRFDRRPMHSHPRRKPCT
jgi:hypothetical protein